tara:strand:- start:304 stop:633 length:330 start_codon:yes stop_codon:yes gene_type:complete
MVDHPSEYPWSSYASNALGKTNELVVEHALYKRLGQNSQRRCEAYRALFDVAVEQKTIEEIREATNKSWVLGSDFFKEMIVDKINRPMNPRSKGGDRKSKLFKDKINRV